MAPEITSLPVVYLAVYSGVDQRKHQSSASLAFVWGIHRGPVNSTHKWPVTRKNFPFDDVIMSTDLWCPGWPENLRASWWYHWNTLCQHRWTGCGFLWTIWQEKYRRSQWRTAEQALQRSCGGQQLATRKDKDREYRCCETSACSYTYCVLAIETMFI